MLPPLAKLPQLPTTFRLLLPRCFITDRPLVPTARLLEHFVSQVLDDFSYKNQLTLKGTPCVGRSRFRLGALVPSVGAQAVLRLGMLQVRYPDNPIRTNIINKVFIQGQNVVEVYIPNIPAGFNFSTGSFEYVQIGWLDEDVGSFLAPYMVRLYKILKCSIWN